LILNDVSRIAAALGIDPLELLKRAMKRRSL
jgi:hypothetical protein